MHDEIIKAMTDGVAVCTGPVTRCPAGKARGRHVKRKNAAVQWLIEHRDGPTLADQKVQRRRLRKSHAQRRRIADRNSPLLKKITKQESRAAFNQAAVTRLNEQERRTTVRQ